MSQYSTLLDADGNLWMEGGNVICFHATTQIFPVGEVTRLMLAAPGSTRDDLRRVGASLSLQGGSGRNVRVSGGPGGTTVPTGHFTPRGPNSWSGPGGSVMSFDPGDDSASLHDGTGVLATLAPGGATIAPYGTFNSTPYGTTLNGGTPFTVDVAYEGAPATYPPRPMFLDVYAGTAERGRFLRTGWQAWEHAVDSSWTISIDGSGQGELSDGTDIVATREADPEKLYDPAGTWNATLYGMVTYNGSDAWAATATLMSAFPVYGFLFVELKLDALTNEVLSVPQDPKFAAALPPNIPNELAIVPIAISDGFGGITQVQEGPIFWKP